MLSFLRQLARAITGKVEPLEFTLGIFFGVWLGMMPLGAVDPGTGFFGLNGLWLLVLLVFLVLRASIPVALVFAALTELLAIAFLDRTAFAFGRSTLDAMGPEGLAASWQDTVPSFQLHTYWGFGATVIGIAGGLLVALPMYFVFRRKLPAWRERFAESRFAKALSGFFVFRALRYLIR